MRKVTKKSRADWAALHAVRRIRQIAESLNDELGSGAEAIFWKRLKEEMRRHRSGWDVDAFATLDFVYRNGELSLQYSGDFYQI